MVWSNDRQYTIPNYLVSKSIPFTCSFDFYKGEQFNLSFCNMFKVLWKDLEDLNWSFIFRFANGSSKVAFFWSFLACATTKETWFPIERTNSNPNSVTIVHQNELNNLWYHNLMSLYNNSKIPLPVAPNFVRFWNGIYPFVSKFESHFDLDESERTIRRTLD
jgi:hypothetical protein